MQQTLETTARRFLRPANAPREIAAERARRVRAEAAAEQLAALVARDYARLRDERTGRERAERAADELARMVSRTMRRADDDRSRRIEAERVASDMAELVAREHARAEEAEDRARTAYAELLELRAAAPPRGWRDRLRRR